MRALPPSSFAVLLNTDQLDANEQARRDVALSFKECAQPPSKKPKGQPLQYTSRNEEPYSSTPSKNKGRKRQFPTQKGAQRQCSNLS